MPSHLQPMIGKRCVIRGHSELEFNGLHGVVAQLFFTEAKTPLYAVRLDRHSPKHTYVPPECVYEAPDYDGRICRQCGAAVAQLVVCLTCMLPDDDDRPRSFMAYCSEACREKHRPQHKEECNGILAYAWYVCSLPGDLMPADGLEHGQGWSESDWPQRDAVVRSHRAVGCNQRGAERFHEPDTAESYDAPLRVCRQKTWWQQRDERQI